MCSRLNERLFVTLLGSAIHQSHSESVKYGICTNLLAVLRVGEVDKVVIVHFLCVDDVTVLFLAQVLWVDAIGSQELLVGHTERLTDGLGYELGLNPNKGQNTDKTQADKFSEMHQMSLGLSQ